MKVIFTPSKQSVLPLECVLDIHSRAISEKSAFSNFQHDYLKGNPMKTAFHEVISTIGSILYAYILAGPTLNRHVKYLSVILGAKLNWRLNIKPLVKIANIVSHVCKRSFVTKWELRPKVVLRVNAAIVHPILICLLYLA